MILPFNLSRSRGFTLIEVVITAAIIAILASAVAPFAELTVKREKEQELNMALRQLRRGIDAYKLTWDEGHIPHRVGESGYPPSLKTLVDGVKDYKDPKGARIYFLRRIPLDPMNSDANLTPAETWGKRSYESSHENPQEGKDVYDVYSLSRGIGLNGIPYRDW